MVIAIKQIEQTLLYAVYKRVKVSRTSSHLQTVSMFIELLQCGKKWHAPPTYDNCIWLGKNHSSVCTNIIEPLAVAFRPNNFCLISCGSWLCTSECEEAVAVSVSKFAEPIYRSSSVAFWTTSSTLGFRLYFLFSMKILEHYLHVPNADTVTTATGRWGNWRRLNQNIW